LAPEKSLHVLVEAFAAVHSQHPGAYLVLVGDGPMRAQLTDQIGRLGCQDRTRFVGTVTPLEIPLWLQMANVFSLVSPSEGFPCALVEAMSAGLASVVSDIPANQQLVESERHGLLFPPGDAAAVASALIKLLDDPALRTQMGAEARHSVTQQYGIERVLTRYETLLGETIPTERAFDWRQR
jgi:glycosyltransferase involved in cell wall biosynthesis